MGCWLCGALSTINARFQPAPVLGPFGRSKVIRSGWAQVSLAVDALENLVTYNLMTLWPCDLVRL